MLKFTGKSCNTDQSMARIWSCINMEYRVHFSIMTANTIMQTEFYSVNNE